MIQVYLHQHCDQMWEAHEHDREEKWIAYFIELLYLDLGIDDWETLISVGVPEAVFEEFQRQCGQRIEDEKGQPQWSDCEENEHSGLNRSIIYAWLADVRQAPSWQDRRNAESYKAALRGSR